MQVQYPCCCGLDVHKASVVACLVQLDEHGHRSTEIRTFGTTTDELLALGDWLCTSGATHVAMEATGSYWKPVYNILERSTDHLGCQCRAHQGRTRPQDGCARC